VYAPSIIEKVTFVSAIIIPYTWYVKDQAIAELLAKFVSVIDEAVPKSVDWFNATTVAPFDEPALIIPENVIPDI
jgi:hypothetical protein